MKKPVLALFAIAFVCAPAVPDAVAQQSGYENSGYYAKALEQQKAARQKKKEPSLYGDMASGGFEEGVADYGGGGSDNDSGDGFHQMIGGGDGDAVGIQGFIKDQDLESSTTGRAQNARQRAASEAQKRRDETIKKMKANSDRLLRQQKERAWRLSNPGRDYPGADDGEDGWSGSDADTVSDGGGWSGVGDDGGGGSDGGWGDWGGGGSDEGGDGDWSSGGGDNAGYGSSFVTEP